MGYPQLLDPLATSCDKKWVAPRFKSSQAFRPRFNPERADFPAALSAATLACCRLGWMLTVVMVAYVHVYAHARACHKLDCRLPGYNFQWRIICTRDCKLSSFCITDFFQDSVLGSSVAYFQDMIRLAIRHQNCLGVIHGSTFSSRPCSDWKWRGSRGILGRNAHGAACQVLQNSLCKYQDYEVV